MMSFGIPPRPPPFLPPRYNFVYGGPLLMKKGGNKSQMSWPCVHTALSCCRNNLICRKCCCVVCFRSVGAGGLEGQSPHRLCPKQRQNLFINCILLHIATTENKTDQSPGCLPFENVLPILTKLAKSMNFLIFKLIIFFARFLVYLELDFCRLHINKKSSLSNLNFQS